MRVCGLPHSQRRGSALPCRIGDVTRCPARVRGRARVPVSGLWNPGRVLLRMMRDPGTGRPAPLARLLAILLVVGLVALSAPVLIPVVRWVVDLL